MGGKSLQPFGLQLPELLRHVGIYGSSGAGKSNGIALIVDGLVKSNTPFFLIDFKRTFRALSSDYSDLLVFTVGDQAATPLNINPLIPPPGTRVDVWARKVMGALSHAYCQGAGSESLLLAALNESYRLAEAEGRWPTFLDVLKLLEAKPARGRKGMWMDSARRAVERLGTDSTGEIFCPSDAHRIEELLRRPVIMEMDLLSQAEQTFLSEVLLLWLVQFRMNQSTGRETLKHAVIIEEAHHLLRAPPGVGDGSEPVIHIALREIRELGESIVLATQNASVVPLAVFGNQATTLAFHTKHQKDIQSTAQAMLLKEDARDELGRLPVGEALVKCPRWHDAFRIKLEYRAISKGMVSDALLRERSVETGYSNNSEAISESLNESAANSMIPRPAYKSEYIKEPPFATSRPSTTLVAPPATTPKNETIDVSLTGLELSMLKDMISHPFDGVVRRIERANTSRRKGIAALKSLEKKELVSGVPIWTGKALLKLFEITAIGQKECRELGLGPLPDITHGGIEHRYLVNKTAKKLRAHGYHTVEENRVSDSLIVDVHAEKNGRILALLIETGKSDVRKNIEKTLAASYDEVWVVSDNPAVQKLFDRADNNLKVDSRLQFSTTDIPALLAPTGE